MCPRLTTLFIPPSFPRLCAGVQVVVNAYDGRTFGPTPDSAFANLDRMVQPEEPRCAMHPAALEIWGRNLDGVDPAVTKAAQDASVVSSKEEAERLLEQGTRRPKTLEEIKELRRRLAMRLKSNFPEVFRDNDYTHLPSTEMPTSDFSTTAAAKKSSLSNPFGAAAKQIDALLKLLSEGLEIRRQIIQVSSSEVHHQFDELRKAIEGGAEQADLLKIVDRVTMDMNIQEVVAQEAIMLPFSTAADRFIDLAKQQKRANQGGLLPPAVLSQAVAAGVAIQVSPGSQKYLGSESPITGKTKPTAKHAPGSAKRKTAASRRLHAKARKHNDADRVRNNNAKDRDNRQPTRQGGDTPDKQSGNVPGTQKPAEKTGKVHPNGKPSQKTPHRPTGAGPSSKGKPKQQGK